MKMKLRKFFRNPPSTGVVVVERSQTTITAAAALHGNSSKESDKHCSQGMCSVQLRCSSSPAAERTNPSLPGKHRLVFKGVSDILALPDFRPHCLTVDIVACRLQWTCCAGLALARSAVSCSSGSRPSCGAKSQLRSFSFEALRARFQASGAQIAQRSSAEGMVHASKSLFSDLLNNPGRERS